MGSLIALRARVSAEIIGPAACAARPADTSFHIRIRTRDFANAGSPRRATAGRLSMRSTLIDIAREAGVSAATVDRVLNNRAGVRGRTREIVIETAQRLGYISAGTGRARTARQPRRSGSISCCRSAPTPSSRCCTTSSASRALRARTSTSRCTRSKASIPTRWHARCTICTARRKASA